MSRTQTADEIKVLEAELASLENFVRERSQRGGNGDVAHRVKELISLQRQEHDELVRQHLPSLHHLAASKAVSNRNVRGDEAADAADHEVQRWKLLNNLEYWPGLQSPEQRKVGEASPPVSPRGRAGDAKLDAVYENEYNRLIGNKVGLHHSMLDKIYGDEYLRLQQLRNQERLSPLDGHSPSQRGLTVSAPHSPPKSPLDHIYEEEYRRLMNSRLNERLSPEHGAASPVRQTPIVPQSHNNDLSRIYDAEYRRLDQLRSQERFGEVGERKSPSNLSIMHRSTENTALDQIYNSEYRRLANLRTQERLGEYSVDQSRRSPATQLSAPSPTNAELERIYGLEYARQLKQLASKQVQQQSQASPTHKQPKNDSAEALELEKTLLEHHIKWRRRIASLF